MQVTHYGEIILKKEFFKTEHKYCDMNINYDVEVFHSNSTIKWNSDESVITWHTSSTGTGTVKLSDCRKTNCVIFIGCH